MEIPQIQTSPQRLTTSTSPHLTAPVRTTQNILPSMISPPKKRFTKKKKRVKEADPTLLRDEELDDIIHNFFDDEIGPPKKKGKETMDQNEEFICEDSNGIPIAGIQESCLDENTQIEPCDVHPQETYQSDHSSEEENEVEGLSNNEFHDFVEETSSLYTHEESQNPKPSKIQLSELRKGHTWASIKDCRDFLRMYAVENNFEIYYERNVTTRIRGLCKVDGCPWRVNIRRAKDKSGVVLKKYVCNHTCTGDADSKNMMANASFVASHFEELIKTHHNSFKPNDIITRAWTQLRVNISYHVAWRARNIVLEKMFGNYSDSYSKLPELCKQIRETNPSSTAFCSVDESNKAFTGLCIAFRASLQGFVNGCRPLVGLDGCFLKGKFGGQVLSMNALDGNNGLFPLAVYICSSETYETWSIFLNALAPHLNKHGSNVTFISDRQKGLIKAVADVFPASEHRFCFKHMYKNFKKLYKGDELELLSWSASKSFKVSTHQDFMNQIKVKNEKAHDWLAENDRRQWCRSYFDFTTNCEHVSNNFSESFNQWIGNLRDRPITNFIEKYHLLLMTCLYVRRNKCKEWDPNGIVPMAAEIIEKHGKIGMYNYKVAGSSSRLYCVQDLSSDDRETVDIDRWTCTCRQWQVTGIPCVHAVAVVTPKREPWANWCSNYHTVKAYQEVYADAITPLPSCRDWGLPSCVVLPPVFKRPVGRPKKSRLRDEDEKPRSLGAKKTCTRCGQSGDNKRGCKGEVLSNGNEKNHKNGNTPLTSVAIKKRVRVNVPKKSEQTTNSGTPATKAKRGRPRKQTTIATAP